MKELIPYGSYPIFKFTDIFVFSDVHGELEKLKRLISKLPLTDSSVIVFVGDLIDAGPDSLGVLAFIRDLKKIHKVFVIEGNHEQVFKRILNKSLMLNQRLDQRFLDEFLYKGLTCLDVNKIKEYLMKHDLMSVLNETIPYFETPDLIITHAAIKNNSWLHYDFEEWQNPDYHYEGSAFPLDHLLNIGELIWEGCNESEVVKNLNKYIVCGHQNNEALYDEPRVFATRAFLDCGAGYRREKELFAMHFPSKVIYSSKI